MSSSTSVLTLVLPAELEKIIRDEGERAFPNECCGVLYGRDGAYRVVEEVEPVDNGFESGEQYHRFSITAQVLMRAEKTAAARGQLVLGFYHSHPDHPARPSEYDREHGWPFYSYIIVSILKGKGDLLTSWQLDDQTEQFLAQPIVNRLT